MTTSVDPSKAINELQPWQVNQEKSRNALSSLNHKDIYGRPIAEPDLTNPTRSRWERPLDTIRSFQESIDRGYRQSTYEDPPQPTSTQWTGRRIYGRNGGGSYSEQMSHMPNRVRDSGTPLSNSSGEDQMSSYGVMAAGNHLNDSSVPRSVQPRGQYGGFGYADTGYGESMNHGSRDGSSGNAETTADAPWNNHWSNGGSSSNGAAYPNPNAWGQSNEAPQSPHSFQPPAPQPQAVNPQDRNVVRSSQTAPSHVEPEVKRKNWLGRRFSKN